MLNATCLTHSSSQLYMEYSNVAVKGAVAAVDGNIPPLNCSDHVKYAIVYMLTSDWLFLSPV